MLTAISLVPFGWSVLNGIQKSIRDAVYAAKGRKKEKQEGMLPTFTTVDTVLFIVFFPFRITSWSFQFLVSTLVGFFVFPVACYLYIPLSIQWIKGMRGSFE